MPTVTNIYSSKQTGLELGEKEIFSNIAWYGDLSGIECEDLLRGHTPGAYLLREGERRFQYYLSYVIDNPFTFRHQPFILVPGNSEIVWGYRNGAHCHASSLESLIPMAMHCPPNSCYPLAKKAYAP